MLSWGRSHWRGHWYLAAINLAILITTKETFTVTVFCLVIAFLSTGRWMAQYHAIRVQWHDITAAAAVCLVLVLFTFSSGFRWADGLREMFLAIPQWVGRSSSDVGHVKPFIYYLKSVIFVTEPEVLLGLGLAAILTMVRFAGHLATENVEGSSKQTTVAKEILDPLSAHRDLTRFMALWFLTSLLIYSLIPYKTVWLIINITLPGTLLSAAVISSLCEDSRTKYLGYLAACATAAASFMFCCRYNFTHYPLPGLSIPVAKAIPYGQANPFSYVHTSVGTLEVSKIVKDYWEKHPQARVLVGVEGYFPLPYYLREKQNQVAYMPPKNMEEHAKEFDILILDYYKSPWSSREWTDPNWQRSYYRLSDYTEAYVFVKASPQGPTAQ